MRIMMGKKILFRKLMIHLKRKHLKNSLDLYLFDIKKKIYFFKSIFYFFKKWNRNRGTGTEKLRNRFWNRNRGTEKSWNRFWNRNRGTEKNRNRFGTGTDGTEKIFGTGRTLPIRGQISP